MIALLTSLAPAGVMALLAILAVPFALVLANSPSGRLIGFVGAGMVVFGRQSEVSAAKFAFLGLAGLFALASIGDLTRRRTDGIRVPEAVVHGVLLLLSVIVMAAAMGVYQGASVFDIFRDAITYVFIICGVLIGAAAAQVNAKAMVGAVAAIAGSVAAISYTLSVAQARGISRLDLDGLALGSPTLAALGIAYMFSRAFDRTATWRASSAFVGFSVIAVVLASGTRSGALLLLCVLGAAVASGRSALVSTIRGVIYAGIGVAAILALGSVVGGQLVDVDAVSARMGTVGSIVTGESGDASVDDRLDNTRMGIEYFADSPALGQGFGVVSSLGPGSARIEGVGYYLDSPALFLAKFGVLGSALLALGLLMLLWVAPRSSGGVGPDHRARAACLAWAAYMLSTLPLSAFTEDRGFAMAIALAVALGTPGILNSAGGDVSGVH